MSHAVNDSRKLARNLQRANRAARGVVQGLGQPAAGSANVVSLSDAIAEAALAGLQSRGLVE